MEKQAANTIKMFIKFQDELIETMANPATKIDDAGTITTYRVAKFGENRASQLPCSSRDSTTVRYNSLRQEPIKTAKSNWAIIPFGTRTCHQNSISC